MRVVLLLAVAGSILSWTSLAYAGTAQVIGSHAQFQADPGEANHVTVTIDEFTANVIFSDSGSALTPGTGCVGINANTVTCDVSIAGGVVIDAGDLADFVSVASIAAYECTQLLPCERHQLFGGDGDDVLIGGRIVDELFGGQGNDTLRAGGSDPMQNPKDWNFLSGGPGDDLLLGGPGGDNLEGDEGADIMSGGGGTDDRAIYSSGPGPVTVLLDDEANDGASAEGDDVRSDIEIVEGSDRNDLLVGSADANLLVGGLGDDVLVGGRGPDTLCGSYKCWGGAPDGRDTLIGGPGRDALWGGGGGDTLRLGAGRDSAHGNPGDDTIFARDHEKDRLSGGPGHDRARVDRLDLIALIEELC
jgi:Ca2+-binding RTX toxin-like protein